MKGLLLAGGYGTRLGPIGQKIPKAMLMVEGDTALGHLIRKLDEIEVEYIIIANEKFKDFFESYDNLIIEETTSDTEKPGAISAINQIIQRENIDDDLFVLASDNYFSEGFQDFIDHYDGDPMIGVSFIGSKPDLDPTEMGTLGFNGCDKYPPPDKSFEITEFKEKSPEPVSEYIGTGAYILPKSILPDLEEFCAGKQRDNMGSLIEYFLENEITVKGYHFTGEWRDVSHTSYLEALSDGKLVKSDDRYIVVDKKINGIVFSITILHAGKQTSGHAHEEAGEVYFFAEGKGVLELDNEKRTVSSGDAIPIPPGTFHRVYNNSDKDLVFLCAFEKYSERG